MNCHLTPPYYFQRLLKAVAGSSLLLLGLLLPLLIFARQAQAKPFVTPATRPQTPLTTTLEAPALPASRPTFAAALAAPDFQTALDAAPQSPVLEITHSPAAYLRPEMTPEYQSAIAAHELMHGDRSRPAIALTFDCEGRREALERVVGILDDNGATGTFFLLGETVAATPEIVPLLLAGGHELGNHSYHHPRFSTLTYTEVLTELMQTEAIISEAAGEPLPLRFFRFPYGDRDQTRRDWIAEAGYQSVFWDVDAQGWRNTVTATEVISTVVSQAQPGSIVLMHCGAAADELALPTVIAELRARGFALVGLSEVVW